MRGLLDGFAADYAVIDVNGVGYLVFASSRTLSALGAIGEEVVLHTEMLVAEDDIRLIGFATAGERDWFRLLTSVQGVGARVALAILSALSVDEVHRAVASGDSAMIARAQGVGPKLAQRIVNEIEGQGRQHRARSPRRARAGRRAAPAPDAVSALAQSRLPPGRGGGRCREGGSGARPRRHARRAGAHRAQEGGAMTPPRHPREGGDPVGVRAPHPPPGFPLSRE